MGPTSTLSMSLKLIRSLTQLSQTQFGQERSKQIVASPCSQKLLIVPLTNLLEALVCAREAVIQPGVSTTQHSLPFFHPPPSDCQLQSKVAKKKKKDVQESGSYSWTQEGSNKISQGLGQSMSASALLMLGVG